MANLTGNVPPTPIAAGLPPISSEWRSFFSTLLSRTGGAAGSDSSQITVAQLVDATDIGRAILRADDGSAVRGLIGAGSSNLTLADVAKAMDASGTVVRASYEAGVIATSLEPTGVKPGTYNGITIGADGRVTAAASQQAGTAFDYATALGLGL
jgi:hypothetical protein